MAVTHPITESQARHELREALADALASLNRMGWTEMEELLAILRPSYAKYQIEDDEQHQA